MVQDLHLGQHPVGVTHEVPEQLELGGRKLDLLSRPPHLVAFLVQFQVREREAGGGLAAVAAGAPQHGPDPGDHFLQAEWLGDVVVTAERQPADLVLGRVARGEEHHGHAGAAAS